MPAREPGAGYPWFHPAATKWGEPQAALVLRRQRLHHGPIQLAQRTPSRRAGRYAGPELLVQPEPAPVEIDRLVGRRQLGPGGACVGQHLPDEAAWVKHLEQLGISALAVTPDPAKIATEGAVWGSVRVHGLLPDTVILSDDAGQFALDRHALC